jgi:ketopantoate reductase
VKILIFGTGVIGSTTGWQLQNNNEITHYVRSDKISKLELEGLLIKCTDLRNRKNPVTEVVYRPNFVSSLDSITNYDVCFVSVKSNQLISVLKEYKNELIKIPMLIMQNVGLDDYLFLKDTYNKNVSFAYPFIMGGGRESNSINCTIFNSPINEFVFGNFSGKKTNIEKELMKEFRESRLKPRYTYNIVAYLKLHYVWATCVLASYIESGSYENFIKISSISKSYKAMVECFRLFRKEKINSRVIFPYNLYHLPSLLLSVYSKMIYNTKAMENMVVGHITSSPDEMQIMFDNLVAYSTDELDKMESFNSYITPVNRYFNKGKKT